MISTDVNDELLSTVTDTENTTGQLVTEHKTKRE